MLMTQLYHLDRLSQSRHPDDRFAQVQFKADTKDAYKYALQALSACKLIQGVNLAHYKLLICGEWVNGVFDIPPYSSSDVEIVNLLMLSTGHIPKTAADVLTSWSGNKAAPLHVSATETGWYISFSDLCTQVLQEHTGTEGVQELIAVLEYALSIGCQHIRFCEMVPTINDLPTWDW